ncbi:MAG: hypothetical protein QOE14_1601 [Humisphaera sp.]|nr:hypothetical protein [Humisphaera sp.]
MFRLIGFSTIVLLVATSVASADPRPFAFTNDTYPVGKGNWEYEQWATLKQSGDENVVQFRHELEFGVADNFDLAFYLPNWSYESTDGHDGPNFDSVSVEGVVYFMNPVTDAIGLGWYNEISVGEDALEFETKLLVQKDIGNWVFAYNLVLETELEGVFDAAEENEVEGVVEHTFGASYAIGRGDYRIGGELVVESIYPDWSTYEHTAVYAGPVFSYWGAESFWFTVTPMVQLSNQDDEADFQVRVLGGYQF